MFELGFFIATLKIFLHLINMELKKNLIGHTWRSKNKKIVICEENIKLLQDAGADVFEPIKEAPKKKRKTTKYKGIKQDDNTNTKESAE